MIGTQITLIQTGKYSFPFNAKIIDISVIRDLCN
jgi:hypothetical protein